MTELSDKNFKEIIQKELPQDMATKSMTLYDSIFGEGEQIGEKKGKKLGKIEGKIEKALEVTINLLLETGLSDFTIASAAGIREETVAEARKIMREQPKDYLTALTPQWLENMEKSGVAISASDN